MALPFGLNRSGKTGVTDATILIGEITMYFGDISIFPTATHALCDGLNNTPDLRGKFVRAWSDTVGQEFPSSPARRNDDQVEAVQNHSHNVNYDLVGSTGAAQSVAVNKGISIFFTQPTDSTGGPETRPKNFALAFIMRIS